MKIKEKFLCKYCESEYVIIYYEEKVFGRIDLCPYCGESAADEEYIDEDDEDEE